jgi:hypothetical protein
MAVLPPQLRVTVVARGSSALEYSDTVTVTLPLPVPLEGATVHQEASCEEKVQSPEAVNSNSFDPPSYSKESSAALRPIVSFASELLSEDGFTQEKVSAMTKAQLIMKEKRFITLTNQLTV